MQHPAGTRANRPFERIVGESAALRHVLDQLALVAPQASTVLIQGESGTGKELFAREIHRRSARCAAPLIRVNCASIPSGLCESELFGHVRGAFTGAVRDRAGRFELADAGTLFLDEVGELPFDVQAKLLRVLQEGQYERVGDGRTRDADVRILAATNRDLAHEVAQKAFRSDLFYRLNVFPLHVPPLRRRREDIPLLAQHFVDDLRARLQRPELRLSEASLEELSAEEWPGNVRELQNTIERAAILTPDGELRFHLARPAAAGPPALPARGILREEELRLLERENVLRALEQTGGRVSGPLGAAALLGMKPSTLASRVRRLGLRKARER